MEFGHQVRSNCEVLLGPFVVSSIVVSPVNTFPILIPVPGYELNSNPRIMCGKNYAVEISQHFVVVHFIASAHCRSICQKRWNNSPTADRYPLHWRAVIPLEKLHPLGGR